MANFLLPYETRVLSNGMFVLVKPMPGTPVAAADIWVDTGSYAEHEAEWGLSHFIEHMLFKGTERRGVGQVDREVAALGGYMNAATSYDFTHYYIALPAEHVLSALDILSDTLFHSLFDAEELDKERQVVIEEIKRHEDFPQSKMYDLFMEQAFRGTNYARSILGTEESLSAIDRDALVRYYTRRYAPANCNLFVVGNVDPEAVFAEVERLFCTPAGDAEASLPCGFPDAPEHAVQAVEREDLNQTYLLCGHVLPRLAGTREMYAVDVLSTILGEGRSSRLYRRLTEQLGLCPDVRTSFFDMKHLALLMTDASFEADDYGKVRGELDAQFDAVRQAPPGERELAKAKKMLVSNFAFANQRAANVAGTFGQCRIHSTLYDAVVYNERIESVEPEEVLTAAQKYLAPETYREIQMKPA